MLSVVFYHCHLGCPGGYVGVDIFFVISGYLITGILLQQVGEGRFSFLSFWERRIRRLVPALAVMTLITALLGYTFWFPDDLQDLGGALMTQPLLTVNVYFWRVVLGGYFGSPPENRPLLHTWSLAVEEQFYVILPLLLVLLSQKNFNKARIGWCFLILITLSFGLSCLITPLKPVPAFFLLPTRAWELLLGSLLVVASPNEWLHRRWSREFLGLFGATLLYYSIFHFQKSTPFPGFSALSPCLGTMSLILSGPSSMTGRILCLRWLVAIGKVSYSFYLWHWPLIALGDYTAIIRSTERKWLVVGLSLALAYLSWRWLETPFREKRFCASRKSIFILFFGYGIVTFFLGGLFWLHRGFPYNWSERALRYANARKDIAFTHDLDLKSEAPIEPAPFGATTGPAIVIWGDSHAMALVPVLDLLGKEYGVRGYQITRSATAPILDWQGYQKIKGPWTLSPSEYQKWCQTFRASLKQKDVCAVLLAADWMVHQELEEFPLAIARTQDEIKRFGKKPIVVLDVDLQDYSIPANLAYSDRFAHWPRVSRSSIELLKKNQRLLERLPKDSSLEVLDPTPLITMDGMILEEIQGVPLYRNPGHLSASGALFLRPLFEPLFQRISNRKDHVSGTLR